MSFESRANASAGRLVRRFGEGLTVTIRSVGGAFVPSTRGVSTSVSTMTVACTEPEPFAKSLVDGTRIEAGDLRISIQADDPNRTFDPEADMLAEIRSKTYRVQKSTREAGGFELQLRGLG